MRLGWAEGTAYDSKGQGRAEHDKRIIRESWRVKMERKSIDSYIPATAVAAAAAAISCCFLC